MKATYGFRATMTARPGKGDELIDLLLSATTEGSGASENCLVYLVGRSAGNRDVVHVTEGWTTQDAHAENFARRPRRLSHGLPRSLATSLSMKTNCPSGDVFVGEVPQSASEGM
jgi:quinol monooxygenase YgiN